MIPASVSIERRLFVILFSAANLATHRTPLPHISAWLPSGLKILILTDAFLDFSKRINPSAPIEDWRPHNFFETPPASFLIAPERLSTTIKSLPAPDIFVKFKRVIALLPGRSARFGSNLRNFPFVGRQRNGPFSPRSPGLSAVSYNCLPSRNRKRRRT